MSTVLPEFEVFETKEFLLTCRVCHGLWRMSVPSVEYLNRYLSDLNTCPAGSHTFGSGRASNQTSYVEIRKPGGKNS